MLVRYSASFICAVFFITGAVSGEDKAVGDTVSFRPAEIVPPVTSIIWKHKSSTGPVVKAIEWDTDDGKIILNPRFKGITSLDEKTGVITITNLTVEHSGLYTIDINSKEQEQRFTLNVMERVPKPKITIKSTNADGVPLRCDYNGTIIWKNSTGQTVEDKKNEITVKNTGNPENFYTCTLKNAVSVETSDPVYERELFGTVAGLIAGIVIFVILLLIIISLICVYLLKESFRDRVNARCPRIESVLKYVDCCKKNREEYVLASTVNHENDETREGAVIPVNHENDETREGAVIPVNQENDETTKVAVSPDQNDVHENNSDSTQSK